MDVARIGFSAPTGPLKDAKTALEALIPAAQRAEGATNKFNAAAAGITRGAGGASAGIKSFQAAATGAAGGTDRLSKSALATGTAMGTVGRAAVGAAAPIGNLVSSVTRMNTQMMQADAHVEAYRNSLLSIPAAAGAASSSLARMGAAANDNINAMQATPGNIAAQFQDIGVTAAAGMSPMLIALQQGTQLSSAMSGGIGNLLAGFRQLFSFTTILTIGLVGLAAAGLQMVDWMSVGQTLLYGLADAVEQFSVAVAIAGAIMLVAFAPQILTWITKATIGIGVGLWGAVVKATLAMLAFAAVNPWTALILGAALVVGAIVLFAKAFKSKVGDDTIEVVRKVTNFIVSSFLAAFDTVEQRASGIANVLAGIAESNPIKIAGGWEQLKQAPSFYSNLANRQGVDYVGKGIEFVTEGAEWIADKIRGLAGNMGATGADAGTTDRAAAGGQSQADKYADIVAGINAEIAALRVESNALNMSASAAALYRNQQELLAEATAQGITLTAAQKDELMGLAAVLTDAQMEVAFKQQLKGIEDQMRALKDANALIGLHGVQLEYEKNRQELVNQAVKDGTIDLNNMTEAMRLQLAMLENRAMALAKQSGVNATDQFFANATKSGDDALWAQGRELGELGLAGEALASYRRETELLNAAREKGIPLGTADLERISREAATYGAAEDATQRQIEAKLKLLEIERNLIDAQKAFVKDFVTGMMQGKSVLDSLNDALSGFIDKLLNKGLDMLLDNLFNNMGGSGNSGGGLAALFSADGNAFDSRGVKAFAKGGAFTNSVVSSPTLFKFAKGGALGVMGEAGPEAIVPLKRGSDGSLGVEMHGGGRSAAPVVNDVTVNNTYTVQGALSSQDILTAIRQGGEQTKDDVKRQLQQWLAQIDRDGAVV